MQIFRLKILEMYITDTMDLFIAGRIDNSIAIYMIDLDVGNIKNWNDAKQDIA